MPGPADYAAWYACWKVYSNILLMLRFHQDTAGAEPKLVATPAALECYLEAFRQLAADTVECWHLCCKAEDRARAEHMPRMKRQLERDAGKPVTWSEVFVAVARDDRYWDKEVRRPALAFLARGNRHKPPADPESMAIGAEGITTLTRSQKRRQSRQKRMDAMKVELEDLKKQRTESQTARQTGSKHPRKSGKFFMTDEDGTQICFNRHKGTCTEPCPNNRAHLCQLCLKPHKTKDCLTARKSGEQASK